VGHSWQLFQAKLMPSCGDCWPVGREPTKGDDGQWMPVAVACLALFEVKV
jgi:hypothetical protein